MGYCKNCGGKLEDNAKFCVICGTKVETEGEVVQTPTQQETQPITNEEAQQTNVNVEAKVEETKPIEQPQPQVLQQQTPIEQNDSNNIPELNNPANYPHSAPSEPLESNLQHIVVPSNANINISQTIKDEARNDAMTDIQTVPGEEQQPIRNQIPKPISSLNANKVSRKKKKSNSNIIHIIALVIGSLVALVIIGFLFTFGLSYINNLDNGGKNNTPKLELNSKNSYRVGSKDYGYVSVPNSWSPFGLSPENQTIQYTDGTGWIVTLYSVDQSTITAKNWANNIVAQMNSVGASDIGMEETEVNEFGGYKLFGYYSNVSTYLAAWVINGNDGKVHYIAIEGPERYNDFYDIIFTFNPTK